MTAFDALYAVIYNDPHLSKLGFYTSVDTGERRQVRVILTRPEELYQFGNIERVLDKQLFRILRRDVPEPVEGDTLEYNGQTLMLTSWLADEDQAEWTMGFE